MANYQIKQGSSAYPLVFLMVQSSDHITGLTGASPSVSISKAGGTFAVPAGAVAEIASGWYKVAGNALDTGTLGPLLLHATAAGGDPVDVLYEVVAHDVQDSTRLGLSALPNAASSATGGLLTVGSGAGQLNPSGGTVSDTTGVTTLLGRLGSALSISGGKVAASLAAADVTGNLPSDLQTIKAQAVTASAGVSFPSALMGAGNVTVGAYAVNQDPGTYVLQTAGNKIGVDSSGRVLLQPSQPGVTIPTVTTANLNLDQAIPNTNTAQSVGDALNAARAQGFGRWTMSGTTLTMYAADGSTVVRTFTLDSAAAPTQRS